VLLIATAAPVTYCCSFTNPAAYYLFANPVSAPSLKNADTAPVTNPVVADSVVAAAPFVVTNPVVAPFVRNSVAPPFR
jgi:hypothetical protein